VKEISNKESSPTADVSRVTDNLFRHEAGRLIAVLTGIFGIERLQLAEDVVQEALARALRTWPYYGVPENPAAWITQTAKNLALDMIRREKRLREKQPDISDAAERWSADIAVVDSVLLENEIEDARLRLMFVCCHPFIPRDAQAALALKTLCGFSIEEIAAAFLSTPAAIAKRLTRAKQRIRDQGIPLEIPPSEELGSRLDGVFQTLYLLFNEGYKASSGDSVVREELCGEAIRLATLICDHRMGDQPRTHALLALMYFNAARLFGRVDSDGNILRLKDQDRSTWDRAMIARGMMHLGKSSEGEDLSFWHLQAGIAGCHCMATDYPSTNWPQILWLYDHLMEIDQSPVVALNRAVALAQVQGPKAGIEAVEAIQNRQALESYYLQYAVLAEFESQLGDFRSAAGHLRQAIGLTELKSEQALLEERLKVCESKITGVASRHSRSA
jgi:RNA polymerase sigma factor (sigma-70 family)